MTRSAAYDSLVGLLADQESHLGWLSAVELPRLSAADVALICREYPHEVTEAACEEFSVTPLVESIETGDVCHVGLKVAVAIAEAARHVIWQDVSEECARRADVEADEYAEAHPESAESLHGVGATFR